MKSTAASIQILSWEQAQAWAYPVRLEVFVKEQGVPKELELDEDDPLAWHAVAELPFVQSCHFFVSVQFQ